MTRGCTTAMLAALFTAVAMIAAGPAARAQGEPTIRVFAAASLTEVVERLAGQYEGARVRVNIGGSGTLARQIRDGAPADVLISANPDWLEFLREQGAIAGEPVVLARNRLVCIAPRNGRLKKANVRDARTLLEALAGNDRVAIADEGVPAGEYARAALRHQGQLEAFLPHLAGQRDVRAVLHVVERGALPAGFVYATDASVGDVETLFYFDTATHPPIEYRAAVVRDASHPAAARRFVEHLRSDRVRSLLLDAGFVLP